MPLTGTGNALGDAIVAAIQTAEGGTMTADQVTQLKKTWEPVATVIVNWITANALVSTNDTGTVTSGPGAGGAVVATGTGTVS